MMPQDQRGPLASCVPYQDRQSSLDRLRERLDRFQQRLDAPDSDDNVPEPPVGIDEAALQQKADAFYNALTRLSDSCSLPNSTLHLQRRKARGLEGPPAPFGDTQATEDIWATMLVHMDPLLRSMDAVPHEWDLCSSASQGEAEEQSVFSAHSLLPVCDSGELITFSPVSN